VREGKTEERGERRRDKGGKIMVAEARRREREKG